MTQQTLPQDVATGRHQVVLQAAELAELGQRLNLPDERFILLLAADFQDHADLDLTQLFELLAAQGLVYLLLWGRDCDRAALLAQQLLSRSARDLPGQPVIPAVSFKGQRLDEAVALARSACPDPSLPGPYTLVMAAAGSYVFP